MNELKHFGVLGMKWGKRKTVSPSLSNVKNANIIINKDGSAEIKPGASLQRLVRSGGKSLPLKDLTYVSINDYDNARYIKEIGGKGFFGGGRDQILSIKTTKKLKAPSLDEAMSITSSLFVNSPDFRSNTQTIFGQSITKKEMLKISKDPKGDTAKLWYETANTSLTFNETEYPGISKSQKILKNELLKRGFNALRDENDFSTGVAKFPLIILEPEKNLKVVTITDITDDLRKANKQKLKAYKDQGKSWLDSQLYG